MVKGVSAGLEIGTCRVSEPLQGLDIGEKICKIGLPRRVRKGNRNRSDYEVTKLLTMSLYFMSLSLNLDLPRRVRKEVWLGPRRVRHPPAWARTINNKTLLSLFKKK